MSTAQISRTVETGLSREELWALVADGAAWASWMVDDADVNVRSGASGTVVDDGVRRAVRVDELDHDRLSFTWWPADDDRLASTVELVVLPRVDGSTLVVTERFPARASATVVTSAGMAWDVRTLLLVLRGAVLSCM